MENRVKEYLIETIAKDCQSKECLVSSDLVEFLLKLLLLNPEYDFVREDTCQTDLTSIVSAVTSKLLDQTRPSLVVLKLQLYFNKHYVSRDEVILKHRKCVCTKTAPLLREIINTSLQKASEQDVEKLYQKIVVFVILLSGLGNPSVSGVIREASVALQSVYRLSELSHFGSLSSDEKERQLTELMCIVAGIRLFNRDLQRGGEGIDDLPSVLQEAIAKTQSATMHVLEKIMNKVYCFTAAVDRTISSTLFDDEEIRCNSTNHDYPEFNSDQIEWAVEMLAAGRQQEVYIRKLIDDIERCDCNVKTLMERLQSRLLKLHESIHSRSAIPTVEIYPQFIDLANIWMQLQDEVVVLSNVNTFIWEMQSMTMKSVDTYDDTLMRNMIDDNQILTDAERLEKPMGKMITEAGDCHIFYPNVTKDFDQIHLEYLGFCALSFSKGMGALIPGNPNIGVVQWNGKYFAFSSREAASTFGQSPERFVNEAVEIVYNHPEYINLLQIYDDLRPAPGDQQSSEFTADTKVVQDQGVQTDLHPLDCNIVKDYTSSTWEYRRRALHLASICQRVTHGSQTYKSHFRTGVYTHAAPPRDREIQTMRDNGVNTNKLNNFIFGLRGRYDDQQHVLNFED